MDTEFTGRWYLVNQSQRHHFTIDYGGYWTRWGAKLQVKWLRRYGFGGDWYVLPVSEHDPKHGSPRGIYEGAEKRYPDAARKYS